MKTASLPQATGVPILPFRYPGRAGIRIFHNHLIEANDALRFDFHIEQVTQKEFRHETVNCLTGASHSFENAGPYELVLDILFKTKENYGELNHQGN